MEDPQKKIEDGKDRLAIRRAWLDQKRKQFEQQYDIVSPRINKARLEDLEVWELRFEMYAWDIQSIIDAEGEENSED
jgi:hypothetical protein